MRIIITACLMASLATVLGCRASAPARSLVPGSGLDGWTQRGGKAVYENRDGVIVGQSRPNTQNSFLCTDRTYGDFELELELKVDPRLNSGIQIRSHSAPGYRSGAVHGYQIEIDPSERAWSGGVYDESRRGWLANLEHNEVARKAFRVDDWNHYRIVAIGDRIRTWVNGVPAADLTDDLTRHGFIALQVHGTKETDPMRVQWRSMRIRDLGVPGRKPPKGAVVLLGTEADASAWMHRGKPDQPIGWTRIDGAIEVKPRTGDIFTTRAFGDCRLHVEFMVDDNGKSGQANGNSGVYLQGRYEVQVLNSAGQEPADNICGAIYGVKAADYNLAQPAGVWQSYDIEFTAARWKDGAKTANARITVYHNGTRIHDNVEIPSNTGAGAAEAPADAALKLQDHGNLVRYRNIWIESKDD